MQKEEKFDLKSELLNNHLETIYPTYLSFKKLVNDYNLKLDTDHEIYTDTLYDSLYDITLNEWRKVYHKFVLDPIKEEITEVFKKALKIDYKLKKPSKFKEKIYCVHYYILQYFSIGILPYHEHDYFPDLGLKTTDSGNLNLLLYKLFNELWYELKIDTLIDDDLFDDRTEFYDLEVKFLSEFLSKCWKEAKSFTNSKAIGILVESTAVGETYSLDENKVLKDYDNNPIY
ncbi:hypothetical protein GCM10011344_05100 [Dokdonia pacifica]|uniref:Uncharacterized protein n=1 Tax=Dokdonia pacifica TaxID=1627892 RepID=A0A238ZNT6_9FLAO|nr:hypothetical protein [Dokdonia pacifica]GGG07541.1 hypothetical protein GCM10011344_05100 [Dokdonia pacifica]SNR84721.1 hypothetical protein SAMN06265376_103373 [Dokdonia pacifica]